MEISEKIKLIRSSKSWTQEDVANKLGISPQAYAKIERGKTDVNFSRLQQIADVMEIELSKLLGLDEKNILLTGTLNTGNNWCVDSPGQTECKHELEKAHLIIGQKDREIEQKDREIEYLKRQASDLRDMIDILKKRTSQS